ncbi:MAG: carboxypeptidase-like regulatory domain-containing protein [Gemmatimonas sp.]|nr:carboxypeptidase-like regulatory domain-containing protein [Gemmatimonas sp.]
MIGSQTWSRAMSACAVVASLLVTPLGPEGPLHAQAGTGTVRGKVTNTAGAPVPNAQVFIAGTQNGGQSGADGTFTITRVTAGTATVRVRMIGYEPTERAATVTGQRHGHGGLRPQDVGGLPRPGRRDGYRRFGT